MKLRLISSKKLGKNARLKPSSKQFKDLQAKWYEKLAEEGFQEIENVRTGQLKQWSMHYVQCKRDKDFALNLIQETNQYFHSAQTVLNDYQFKTERERRIWELHCEGLSTRQIADRMGDLDHCTVFQVVKKIRATFLEVNEQPNVSLVKVRKGTIEDMALIYATWLRPLYYDNEEIGEIDKDDFMGAMKRRVEMILKRPSVDVKIACLIDAPDVILGYSIIEWRKLWWVYVKKAWREMGLAKKLVPPYINSCAYLTRVGKILKPKDWKVSPYLSEELE